jgi:hypothetical protein
VDKQLYEKEDVLSQIIGQIEDSDAIVAVTTGKNPNVFSRWFKSHEGELPVPFSRSYVLINLTFFDIVNSVSGPI